MRTLGSLCPVWIKSTHYEKWCNVIRNDASHVIRNDATWSEMMRSDPNWCDVIWNDATWFEMMRHDSKWCNMIWNDAMWFEIWCDVIRSDATRFEMMQHDSKWWNVDQNFGRRSENNQYQDGMENLLFQLLTVRWVFMGASDNLYSPVTRTFLWTSSLRHFFDWAVNVNEIEWILETRDTKSAKRKNSVTSAMVDSGNFRLKSTNFQCFDLFLLFERKRGSGPIRRMHMPKLLRLSANDVMLNHFGQSQ